MHPVRAGDRGGVDVTLLNGVDTGPLADWVIVCAHGRTLIGREDERVGDLSPVYELFTQIVPSPQGLACVRNVTPLLTLSSIQGVAIPADAIVIRVADLSRDERKSLAQCVAQCEELVRSMRAAEVGVVLAPAHPGIERSKR
jgi:hypothetical protein